MHIHGQMAMHMHVLVRSDQRALLLEESARSGLSMGELVRRSIDAVYLPERRPAARGLEVSLGVWRRTIVRTASATR